MGASRPPWDLRWTLACPRLQCCLGFESKDWPGLPSVPCVFFDDDFTTVPHLRKGIVPGNQEKLVENSWEKSTDEFFDLTKTWMEPEADEAAGKIPPVVDISEDDTVRTSNVNGGGAQRAPSGDSIFELAPGSLGQGAMQTTPDSEGVPVDVTTITQDFEGEPAASVGSSDS